MGAEIVALRCPSCGNSTDVSGLDARFGYRLTCGYCQTQSILVINRQLYVPKPHEHVCVQCGRVARHKAHICQCGASLVKRCGGCLAEYPIDDQLCDQCGCFWYDIKTSVGIDRALAQCIQTLRNKGAGGRNYNSVLVQLSVMNREGVDLSKVLCELIQLWEQAPFESLLRAWMLNFLPNAATVPAARAILAVMNKPTYPHQRGDAIYILSTFAPQILHQLPELVPMLIMQLRKVKGDPLPWTDERRAALPTLKRILIAIGPPALPALEPLTLLFRGDPILKGEAKEIIQAIRQKQ